MRRIFEVNFFASLDLVNEAARRLVGARRGGHLLMCSSCLAKFTLPHYSAYSATKAAQWHLCRAMRTELAPRGIEVSSVHPITTATEFFQTAQRLSSGRIAGDQVAAHAPRGRGVAAFATMFPSFLDLIMRFAAKRDGEHAEVSRPSASYR
jgi:NAD(P)-dependent dehydrogenase (short-subunit alcohol dehydrogenase family)